MVIGCLIGSLRKDSLNRKLFTAFSKHIPEDSSLKEIAIDALPLFNADSEDPLPSEVVTLKKEIESADAILFVSPEYNRSIPGGLKNAIDWATRGENNSFEGKVGAVIGATPGRLGTAPMQMHLKGVMVYLGMKVVGQPEVYVGGANKVFDESGILTDEKIDTLLKKFTDTFIRAL